MQPPEHWEAKAAEAEDVAKAMGHSPDRFAMLEVARLYRLHAAYTRNREKAVVWATPAHPASVQAQPSGQPPPVS
jgi:hypothetical protein